jgi:hypothetical protein
MSQAFGQDLAYHCTPLRKQVTSDDYRSVSG